MFYVFCLFCVLGVRFAPIMISECPIAFGLSGLGAEVEEENLRIDSKLRCEGAYPLS